MLLKCRRIKKKKIKRYSANIGRSLLLNKVSELPEQILTTSPVLVHLQPKMGLKVGPNEKHCLSGYLSQSS